MNPVRRNVFTLAVAVAGLAATAAPLATANSVAWNVSVGGPGFAVSAGQPAFGPSFGPGFHPGFRPVAPRVWVRPIGFRPVVVARPTWVARPVFLPPPPVFFAPRPVFAPRLVVAPRPFVAVRSFPSATWHN